MAALELKACADTNDIAVYVVNRNKNRNKRKLEQAVNIIGKRLSRIGLNLEPKKTVLVEFSKHGGWNRSMAIEINGSSCKE